jgi:hypothetical protein
MVISSVTKKVIKDLSLLSDKGFLIKYAASKAKFLKRLAKYGDPYMKAPLARFGKFLMRLGH